MAYSTNTRIFTQHLIDECKKTKFQTFTETLRQTQSSVKKENIVSVISIFYPL